MVKIKYPYVIQEMTLDFQFKPKYNPSGLISWYVCYFVNIFFFGFPCFSWTFWAFPFSNFFLFCIYITNVIFNLGCKMVYLCSSLWENIHDTKQYKLDPFCTRTLFTIKYNENWHYELEYMHVGTWLDWLGCADMWCAMNKREYAVIKVRKVTTNDLKLKAI